MSDEQNNQGEANEEQKTDETHAAIDDKAVRSSSLFKKVTARQKEDLAAAKSRLAELEAEREKHQAEIEAAKAAEEGRLKEHYQAQLAILEDRVKSFDETLARKDTEYQLRIAAANKGITSPIIQKGLLAEYMTLEGDEIPQPDAWIETLAEKEENAGLFAGTPKPPIGAGLGGKPQTRGGDKTPLSERLLDPTDVEAFRMARERAIRGEAID